MGNVFYRQNNEIKVWLLDSDGARWSIPGGVDFYIRLRTEGAASVVAKREGAKLTNCRVDADGSVIVGFTPPAEMPTGGVRMSVEYCVEDMNAPEGISVVYVPAGEIGELTDGTGPAQTATVEVATIGTEAATVMALQARSAAYEAMQQSDDAYVAINDNREAIVGVQRALNTLDELLTGKDADIADAQLWLLEQVCDVLTRRSYGCSIGHGDYQPMQFNKATGYFEFNGLKDITPTQAAAMVAAQWTAADGGRTNMPRYDHHELVYSDRMVNAQCEVWWGNARYGTSPCWVVNSNVREMRYVNIMPVYTAEDGTKFRATTWGNCPNLETIEVNKIDESVSRITLQGCPKVSLGSLLSIVEHGHEGLTIRIDKAVWNRYQMAFEDHGAEQEEHVKALLIDTLMNNGGMSFEVMAD